MEMKIKFATEKGMEVQVNYWLDVGMLKARFVQIA